jgi:hypothetical protein
VHVLTRQDLGYHPTLGREAPFPLAQPVDQFDHDRSKIQTLNPPW